MRDSKCGSEDEVNGISLIEGESAYPNECASLSFRPESAMEKQRTIVDLSGIGNQQLIYQPQKPCDQDQNLIYFLVPTTENVQVPLPISMLTEQNALEFPLSVVQQPCQDPLTSDFDTQDILQNKQTDTYVLPNEFNINTKTHVLRPIVYHCNFPDCSKYFHSLYDRKLHLDSHIFPENTEFKCGICNMKFLRAADRNKHIESHSIVPTHKCRDCQQNFSYFTVLIKHLQGKRCSAKSPITCYFCKSRITDVDALIKHHQLPAKECTCGVKKCGTQSFELHVSRCISGKSVEPVMCKRKRTTINRTTKKLH